MIIGVKREPWKFMIEKRSLVSRANTAVVTRITTLHIIKGNLGTSSTFFYFNEKRLIRRGITVKAMHIETVTDMPILAMNIGIVSSSNSDWKTFVPTRSPNQAYPKNENND